MISPRKISLRVISPRVVRVVRVKAGVCMSLNSLLGLNSLPVNINLLSSNLLHIAHPEALRILLNSNLLSNNLLFNPT